MIWKTTLAFWVSFFWVGIALAQFTPEQPDLRDCTGWNCTSNNFTLDQVYITLEDGDGNPLTNQACTIGDQEGVYVMLNYTSNANNTVNNTRIFADLSVDGNLIPLNIYIGEISGGASGQQQIYGPFTWTCGQELILEDILAVWITGGSSTELTEYDCGDYNKAQCEFAADTIIGAPLAVEFDYTACTYNGVTTVNYNSTTTGGIPPYTYQWDFENDGIIDSTEESPSHDFTTTGNTTKLIITDSQNLVSQYELLIENPEEIIANASITPISCDENNAGSGAAISLTVSGGTGSYNYSWTGPAGYTSDQQNIENLAGGTYNVEITDSVGCIKNYEFEINDPIQPVAQITGNQELSCEVTSITLDASSSTVQGSPSYEWSTGETTATIEVTDAGPYSVIVTDSDNGCFDKLEVTVIYTPDTENPIITFCPSDLTVSADEALCSASEVDLGMPVATDNCDAELSISNDAPEVFELGDTIVTWKVTDATGNETTCLQTIT
uniref:HYR domain-containing protein n=1 Tax=Salegentibacter sediminis TaxID=1930251 RepID=UPI0018E3E46F